MVLRTDSMPAKPSEGEVKLGEGRLDDEKKGYFHEYSREELIEKYGYVPKESKHYVEGDDQESIPEAVEAKEDKKVYTQDELIDMEKPEHAAILKSYGELKVSRYESSRVKRILKLQEKGE